MKNLFVPVFSFLCLASSTLFCGEGKDSTQNIENCLSYSFSEEELKEIYEEEERR